MIFDSFNEYIAELEFEIADAKKFRFGMGEMFSKLAVETTDTDGLISVQVPTAWKQERMTEEQWEDMLLIFNDWLSYNNGVETAKEYMVWYSMFCKLYVVKTIEAARILDVTPQTMRQYLSDDKIDILFKIKNVPLISIWDLMIYCKEKNKPLPKQHEKFIALFANKIYKEDIGMSAEEMIEICGR